MSRLSKRALSMLGLHAEFHELTLAQRVRISQSPLIITVLLPHRFATIYDVTANSLGAALGCVAVYAWRTRRRS